MHIVQKALLNLRGLLGHFDRFISWLVDNFWNNNTIILLNLAKYRLILAISAYGLVAVSQTIFRASVQDNCEIFPQENVFKLTKLNLFYSFQMYVELYGDDSQGEGYPAKVYLKLRHMAASYFRDESDTVKEYRQALGSNRTFQYNRFAITDETKCKEELKKGNGECPCWSLCYVVYSTVWLWLSVRYVTFHFIALHVRIS